ncbi:S8 family peptidase [Rhodococcus sp. USK13]|uniref:S8 family peptidase n=1 Tax=Rhodococcus sp. USK13 TaxID=2806442 RepID=UPI001BCFA8D9|nr:S8 family peptidase [Rhodococcus sp. USK13]
MTEPRSRGTDGGSSRDDFSGERLDRQTAPPELEDVNNRRRWGLGTVPEDRGPYLVELNVLHIDGLSGATNAFRQLFTDVFRATSADRGEDADPWRLTRISKGYFRCEMTLAEWKQLVAVDQERALRAATDAAARRQPPASGTVGVPPSDFPYRTIYRLWPDFPVRAHIAKSVSTIKADAALRSFEASGEGICWAVLDSGIDATHPHFGDINGEHLLLDAGVRNLHRCFVDVHGHRLPDPDEDPADSGPMSKEDRDQRIDLHRTSALTDPLGHGTHVAGIISGRASNSVTNVVLERQDRIVAGDEDDNQPTRMTVTNARVIGTDRERERFHGVAPGCHLVSLRVLDDQGAGRSSDIVRALEYIREKLNDNPKLLRVHGVNLSVGYDFDAEMFACGQSPLCTEVNRLVQAGVIVVAAAGNTGYSTLPTSTRVTKVGLSNTINDPGNAAGAITVGSTHRDSPHTFGISYFSSKGPTADGRLKPDLVAPGERIVSCAAGTKQATALSKLATMPGTGPTSALSTAPTSLTAYYLEDSGTSMAAPHVSGAIAAFLSIRQEFIGRSDEVKRIFLASAVPLGRERYFEGHGLVDLMKAIQSV